jgi:hypothetical protein
MSQWLVPTNNTQSNRSLPERQRTEPTGWVAKRDNRRAEEAKSRELDRIDSQAEIQAYKDYSQAKVAVHRAHLTTHVEKAKANARREVTQDIMIHAKTIHSLVSGLSAGDPGLEMVLRGIQEAHTLGEQQRIFRLSTDG